jgi:hypothetical protein
VQNDLINIDSDIFKITKETKDKFEKFYDEKPDLKNIDRHILNITEISINQLVKLTDR